MCEAPHAARNAARRSTPTRHDRGELSRAERRTHCLALPQAQDVLYGGDSYSQDASVLSAHHGAAVYIRAKTCDTAPCAEARWTLIAHDTKCKAGSGYQLHAALNIATVLGCYNRCRVRDGCAAFSVDVGNNPWCTLCSSAAPFAHEQHVPGADGHTVNAYRMGSDIEGAAASNTCYTPYHNALKCMEDARLEACSRSAQNRNANVAGDAPSLISRSPPLQIPRFARRR